MTSYEGKDEYLTLEEVASLLKVSKRTIYRMVKRKELPAFKIGESWRVSKREFEKMIEEKTITK